MSSTGRYRALPGATAALALAGAAMAAAPLGAGVGNALTITPTADATVLASTLFLNSGGLVIDSADFLGGSGQAGIYQNAAGTYGLPVNGIVLSSGNVDHYATGPNTSSGMSSGPGTSATAAQEALLDPITGGGFDHHDVAQLNITFFAPEDVESVTFFGAFGSEEYPEYVGSTYIDGFGLYVNGTNVANAIPTGGADALPINIDHPDMEGIAGTELDGLIAPNGNPVLRFDVPVNAGETNTFEIIIADTSDDDLDSTIYLSSFFADPGNGSSGGLGESEFHPYRSSTAPDPSTGAVVIEVPEVPGGETVWVEPPAGVGYAYEIVGGDGAFASLTAPSLATVPDLDGYFVTVGGVTVPVVPGQVLDFMAVFGVTPDSFTLSGIDPSLLTDPDNPFSFPVGLSFTGDGPFSVGATPEGWTGGDPSAIPLPGGLALYLGGIALAACFVIRRRRLAA